MEGVITRIFRILRMPASLLNRSVSQRDSKTINITRSCRCGWHHGSPSRKRKAEKKKPKRRRRWWQPLQPATKPITINRSATAHSAKSTRFERAAALDYIPHSLRPTPRASRHARISNGEHRSLNAKPCLSLRLFHLASLFRLSTSV